LRLFLFVRGGEKGREPFPPGPMSQIWLGVICWRDEERKKKGNCQNIRRGRGDSRRSFAVSTGRKKKKNTEDEEREKEKKKGRKETLESERSTNKGENSPKECVK